MKLWVLCLFVFLSHCKTTHSENSKNTSTSSNSSVLSLVSTVPDSIKCGKNDGTVLQSFPFSIEFEDKTLSSNDIGTAYLQTLKQSLSTLPTSILNAFADINGSILIVNNAKSYCSVSPTHSPNGIGSCWSLNADQSFTLYISMTDQNENPSLSALSFNSLMAFGQLFEKIFINDTIYGDGDLFITEKNYQGAESFRFDMVQELLNVSQTTPISTFPLDLSSFMLSHSFFTYYCSDSTQVELKQLFPKSYARIKDLTDHFTPKSIHVLETTADTDFELSLGTVREKIMTRTRSFRHGVQARLLSEPMYFKYTPHTFANDHTKFLRSHIHDKETAFNESKTDSHYSEVPSILGGGFYYTGKPRLISERPIDIENLNPKKVTILIHGTFSGNAPIGKPIADEVCCWATPGGTVANEFKTTEEHQVLAFQWSGLLKSGARKEAGKTLADMIEAFHAAGIEVDLVGHSHGGNVGAAALSLLRKKTPPISIHNFFSIGTPVPSKSREAYQMDSSQFTGNFFFITGKRDAVQGMTGGGTQNTLQGKNVQEYQITGLDGHSDLVSKRVIEALVTATRQKSIAKKTSIEVKKESKSDL